MYLKQSIDWILAQATAYAFVDSSQRERAKELLFVLLHLISIFLLFYDRLCTALFSSHAKKRLFEALFGRPMGMMCASRHEIGELLSTAGILTHGLFTLALLVADVLARTRLR